MAAYTNPSYISGGLQLDFTVEGADTAADGFLGYNASGQVTGFASIPRTRVSGAGNLTETTSSVLTITGGTAAVLTSGLTIQVKLAATGQSGYLSSTDWNTFNNKMGTTLTSANLFVGSAGNVATGVPLTGDIAITNGGLSSIVAGVIVNADVNNTAAIAVSKLAAQTASRVATFDGSGFLSPSSVTTTTLAFLDATSSVQTQINTKLTVSLTGVASGDFISYNGVNWVNVTAPAGGLPVGGTAAQFLTKINGTNYNAQWTTLTYALITDVTPTLAQVNALSSGFYDATSSVQGQMNSKLDKTLATNSMFVGVANVATALASGSDGYVLTSVLGVPTWVAAGSGGTVTSVAASGGTTGMTWTGSPITTSGTLTLAGTLVAANGGTGQSSYTIGDLLYASGAAALSKLGIGSSGYVLTVSGGLPTWQAAPSGSISTLTAAIGTNTINNAAFAQEWQWNSLAGGTGLALTSTSTAAASNTQALFYASLSGANGTASQTTYAAYIQNIHSGTTPTNIALALIASGGSINKALYIQAGDFQMGVSSRQLDSQGNPMFGFTATGSAVNYFQFTNGAAASAGPIFSVVGTDSNIDLNFQTKGTGTYNFTTADFSLANGVDFSLGTGAGTKFGTSTTQKLSFWNKTAIVQPTTGITGATRVGGGGTTLTDTDTFGGYTVAQLAAIIINTGLGA